MKGVVSVEVFLVEAVAVGVTAAIN